MKEIFRVRIIIAAFLILSLFNSSYAMGQWLQITPKPKVASDFTLYDLDGNKVSLSDFKGKRQLLLFFWTTWCPHCREQLESLNALSEKLKDKNVTILAIDTGESLERIKRFIEKFPISFAMLLDIEQDVTRNYGIVGVPTFVIVDFDGSIKFHENYLPDNIQEMFSGN